MRNWFWISPTVPTDTEAPRFTNVPDDVLLSVEGDARTVSIDWTMPSVSDNLDTNVALTSTHASGHTFPVGTTFVIFTATDTAGNVGTASFSVTLLGKLNYFVHLFTDTARIFEPF